MKCAAPRLLIGPKNDETLDRLPPGVWSAALEMNAMTRVTVTIGW
jgi:hypothetical protein